MSYHNGSVWPHDNALIALGLARYTLKPGVLKILSGLFAASIFVNLHRMPELFCGFQRRPGEGPTAYPVACSPQAWAAGSVFLLMEAVLGLRVCALPQPKVTFLHPELPEFIDEIYIRRLQIGDAEVDLMLRRHREDIGVSVLRREGYAEVTVVK
jgi:glycogen debranching enzyme